MKYGIVIKNSKIPQYLSVFIKIYAITLWPFIFFKDEGNEIVLNHERIHIAQQRELLVVFFYLLYVSFWLFNLMKYKDIGLAYYNIPFEREARAKQGSRYYVINRRHFAWKNYIRDSQ